MRGWGTLAPIMTPMATITITRDAVQVRFTTREKIGGLIRDIEVPLSQVTEVAVENDALGAVRGLRAPGLALPGRRKIGTWRGRGRTAVSVTAGQPAVRIELSGDGWDRLLIGHDDPPSVVDQLAAR